MLGHGQAQSTASLGVRVTRAGRNGGGPVPDPTRKSIAVCAAALKDGNIRGRLRGEVISEGFKVR